MNVVFNKASKGRAQKLWLAKGSCLSLGKQGLLTWTTDQVPFHDTAC